MSETLWSPGFLAFYLTFCIFSLIGSVFVAVSILRFGSSTLSARLVLYLHYSQIIQDLMAIPYIWWYDDAICEIAGFLHIYSGIANIMCVTIMVIAYRFIFFPDEHKICDFCLKYLIWLVFVFPLLALLCFTTGSYGGVTSNLCSYHQKHSVGGYLWTVLFAIFSFCVFVFCVTVVTKTVLDVFKADKVLGVKLFKTLVFYAFATFVFWVPRTVFQAYSVSPSVAILSNCMIFAAGILYSLIFLQEKKSLKSFEQQNQNTTNDVESVVGDNNSMSFSMSFDDDADRLSRTSNVGPSVVLRGFQQTLEKERAQNPMIQGAGSMNSVDTLDSKS